MAGVTGGCAPPGGTPVLQGSKAEDGQCRTYKPPRKVRCSSALLQSSCINEGELLVLGRCLDRQGHV